MPTGIDLRTRGAGSQSDWARQANGQITALKDGDVITGVTGTLSTGTITLTVSNGQVTAAVAS